MEELATPLVKLSKLPAAAAVAKVAASASGLTGRTVAAPFTAISRKRPATFCSSLTSSSNWVLTVVSREIVTLPVAVTPAPAFSTIDLP